MPSPFLEEVRRVIRTLHYSIRTEKSYIYWIRFYIVFHNKRHPRDMAVEEIGAFLSYLANERKIAAATQNQALNALNFLYKRVIGIPLGELQGVARAKRPKRLPVVLSRTEVIQLMSQFSGDYLLMARMMYGSGLRLMELLRLRIKDIDFHRKLITVRAGKGDKDRITILPEMLVPYLENQIERVVLLHKSDIEAGFGETSMPFALARKYPNAARQPGWQFVFPSAQRAPDPYTGKIKRHHLHRSSLQNAVKNAVRAAGLMKPVSSHTLRHSLRHTCLKTVTTFAPFRSCSATRMFQPP